MRRASHKDANHRAVVNAFEGAGCSVAVIESAKAGLPDLAVGVAGVTLLVEIKPDSQLARHQPSKAQVAFAAAWRGSPVHVVRSPQQAVELAQLVRLRETLTS